MTTTTMTMLGESSPRRTARIAGAVYVAVFVSGTYALLRLPGAMVANLIATVCYVAVTVLFYFIFKPAGPRLSFGAMIASLLGCVFGALMSMNASPLQVHPFVFFGLYCAMIGALILRSMFLPRVLGALMIFAGLGWLTFISPGFAQGLYPYNLAPGIIGEAALTLWLVTMGVNEERWKEQSRTRA